MLTGTACGGGKVTEADYLEAVNDFTACLAEHDVEVVRHGWDPVNRLTVAFSYSVDAATGGPNPQQAKCESEHLAGVSTAYADQATAVMAEDLRAHVRGCLTAKQISAPTTITNLAGFLAVADEQTVTTCVFAGLAALYPEFPAMVGSR
jgi:hypothetical protein